MLFSETSAVRLIKLVTNYWKKRSLSKATIATSVLCGIFTLYIFPKINSTHSKIFLHFLIFFFLEEGWRSTLSNTSFQNCWVEMKMIQMNFMDIKPFSDPFYTTWTNLHTLSFSIPLFRFSFNFLQSEFHFKYNASKGKKTRVLAIPGHSYHWTQPIYIQVI